MKRERTASYRVQLHAGFPFEAAEAISGYLQALGVSHFYSSPVLQAVSGSLHGYDIVDPAEVNTELGGASGFKRFTDTLSRNNLALIVDIVPNHMALGDKANKWWWDVLENGRLSRFASFFDVDWSPPIGNPLNYDTVLVPVLGDHYGRVLEAGELRLTRSQGALMVEYFDNSFPVSPQSSASVFAEAARACGSDFFAFFADALAALPEAPYDDLQQLDRRHHQKEFISQQLEKLWNDEPQTAAALDEVFERYHTNVDLLDEVLSRQNYRLAFWRVAKQELGYRRFFDVTELIGLRIEREEVFLATHQRILEWLEQGLIDGIRVDHADGLANPEQYLLRLREFAPSAWILVEKILEDEEELPDSWPVEGTTGYDFTSMVNGLFVDPSAEEQLTALYREVSGETRTFSEVVRDNKRLVLREILGGDVNRLVYHFRQVCERHRRYRDYTWEQLRRFVVALAGSFQVYRTYLQPGTGSTRSIDAATIDQVLEQVRQSEHEVDEQLLDFARSILLLQLNGAEEAEFVARLQQLTGPVTAKAVEDTSFYCYHRLISLNEVGGNPARFSVSPELFHHSCQRRLKRRPDSLLATTTHDTKRTEDVRLRINALSETPESWEQLVKHWLRENAKHRSGDAPDRNTEYFIYQTLVGTWPISEERLLAYLQKAAREAKAHTSWVNPDESYEEGVAGFASALVHDSRFVGELEAFLKPLLRASRIHSLSQTLLKITVPGVPDFYQGTEIWTDGLVDPDNRRPVDYDFLKRSIDRAKDMSPSQVMAEFDSGLPKLYLIERALRLRASLPEALGTAAACSPISPSGAKGQHVVAFSRGEHAIVVVPRLVLRLGDQWEDTAVQFPPGEWQNVLTGQSHPAGRIAIGELLAEFPVALLARDLP